MPGFDVRLAAGEDVAEVIVGLRQIGLMTDRLAKMSFRGPSISCTQGGQPHRVMCARQIGVEFQRLVQRCLRVAGTPQLQIHISEIRKCTRVCRT